MGGNKRARERRFRGGNGWKAAFPSEKVFAVLFGIKRPRVRISALNYKLRSGQSSIVLCLCPQHRFLRLLQLRHPLAAQRVEEAED